MDSLLHMDKDWVIVCSQSLPHYVHCICGHRVKRITYLYHKPSKVIQYVGKTCVRKYGIEFSLTNPILLEVIKENLHKVEWDRDACVREHIHSQYTTFMTLAKECADTTVVGPFRRLLSDVCDLVSEYGYDVVDVLREIEQEVESLNQATRHQMVDEYSLCDSISEIASEHSEHLADVDLEESPLEERVIEENPLEERVIEESPIEESPLEESPLEESPIEEERVIEEERAIEEVSEVLTNIVTKITTTQEKQTKINEWLKSGCCCPQSFCYCEMKYRIRRLQEDIIELGTNIQTMRDETGILIQKTTALRISTREYLDKNIEFTSKFVPNIRELVMPSSSTV